MVFMEGFRISSQKPIIIYTKDYENVNYGDDHPFNKHRFRLTYKYFLKIFPDIDVIKPDLLDEDILLLAHSKKYVDSVKKLSAIGRGYISLDTPAFRGMYEWALIYVSGSIKAAKISSNQKIHVFNPCGGLHHAARDFGGGFCIFNDVAITALWLKKMGLKPAIVDWDAHAGDGTMLILYETPILKISIHEDPLYLYPGRGFADEVGEGEGYGYTLNIPLPPLSTDREFQLVIDEIVLPALKYYKPDIIVLQSGGDGHYTDPLTHLNYTVMGYKYAAEKIRSLNIPVVMLGGGGYDLKSLPIIWATVYATLIGRFKAVEKDFNRLYPGEIYVDEKVKKMARKVVEDLLKHHPFLKNI